MTVKSIVQKLKAASDAYYNSSKTIMSDEQFDSLVDKLRKLDPKNSFFKSVGSSSKGEKVKHSSPMGSLDKLRPSDVSGFLSKYPSEEDWVLSPKLDGFAGRIIYKNGKMKRILTRGDGYIGRDITEKAVLVKGTKPKSYLSGNYMVNGEFIVPKSVFLKDLKGKVLEDGKQPYKSPRNFAVGLINSDKLTDQVKNGLHHIVFIAYGLLTDKPLSKRDQLRKLHKLGYITVVQPNLPCDKKEKKYADEYLSLREKSLYSMFANKFPLKGNVIPCFWNRRDITGENCVRFLVWCKNHIDYDMDGVVLDCNSKKYRVKGENLNPDFAKAIKLAQQDQDYKTSLVKKIEWNITNRDVLKPVLILKKPLDFNGASISRVFAHNALYVRQQKIHSGCTAKIIRSGDVIPYIVGIKSSKSSDLPSKCPMCGGKLRWTDTDLYCVNHCYSKKYGRVFKFFGTLGVDNFSNGLVEQLIDGGFTKVSKILAASVKDFTKVLGPNRGKVLHKSLHEVCSRGLTIEKYMYGSNCFQDETLGMGTTRLKQIVDCIGLKNALDLEYVSSKKCEQTLLKVDGLGKSNVTMFVKKAPHFIKWFNAIKKYVPVAKTKKGSLSGKSFCFTGFRDKDLESFIEEHGGKIDGSVKHTTTVLFASDTGSIKAKRAKDLGIKIVCKSDASSYLRGN
jgi:NAD-dependent DNA ligase